MSEEKQVSAWSFENISAGIFTAVIAGLFLLFATTKINNNAKIGPLKQILLEREIL
jgi:hypothetical protein